MPAARSVYSKAVVVDDGNLGAEQGPKAAESQRHRSQGQLSLPSLRGR